MPDENAIDLLQITEHCGCGAKLSATGLGNLPWGMARRPDPDPVIGPETLDDGAVYRLRDDCFVVRTAEFFPPVASDPNVFGRIAACNALRDVCAMGGRPLCALALLCYPARRLGLEIARRILAGAAEKLDEAGASPVGGHTLAAHLRCSQQCEAHERGWRITLPRPGGQR